MNVIGTGMSGLIGSRIKALLSDQYSWTDLSRETGHDITDKKTTTSVVTSNDAPWLFHLAAMTDVQGAEKERDLGQESLSWKINVEATEYIAKLAESTGKRMLYLSTDYVFDGLKDAPYTEEDTPRPLGWYATTKYEGENRVLTRLGDRALILRISNPYTIHQSFGKQDWVHKIIDRIVQKLPVKSPIDSFFSPTFIDDAVYVIDALVRSGESGIWHVGSKIGVTPYFAAQKIADVYAFDPTLITKTSYDTFYEGRAHVPKNGVLSSEKVMNHGCVIHTFEEGIRLVKQRDTEA